MTRPPKLAAHFARTAILEHAMTVFTHHGVEETRVEDLITAAGISRRTFYKYFGSKDEVLAGLYELVTEKLLELVRSAKDAGGAGLHPIHAGIDAYLDFHVVNGRLLRLLVEQAMRSESLLYARRRWFREELVKIIDEVVDRETRRKIDPLAVYALISMLEGLSLHLLDTGAGEAEIARAKRVVRSIVDDALGPRSR